MFPTMGDVGADAWLNELNEALLERIQTAGRGVAAAGGRAGILTQGVEDS